MLDIGHVVVVDVGVQDLVAVDHDILLLCRREGHLELNIVAASERLVQHLVAEVVLKLQARGNKAVDQVLVVVLDGLALAVQPVDDFYLVGKIVHEKDSIEVHLDVFCTA